MRLPTKFRIRNQVLVFGLIMSTLPLILMSTYYLLQVKAELEIRIDERQMLKIENLANQISIEMEQTFQRMEMLSVVYDLEKQRGLLYDFLRQNHSIEEVVILNEFGQLSSKISRYDLNNVEKESSWITTGMLDQLATTNRVFGEVEFNLFGQPIMKLVTPVMTDNRENSKAAIGVTLHLQKIIGEISSYQLNEPGYVYLVDQKKQIIAHQDYTQLWSQRTQSSSEEVVQATTEIEDLQWNLVLEQTKQELLSPMYEMLKKGILVAVVIILFVSILSIYAGLYFVKPIEVLQRAMTHLKKGKWPKKVKIIRQDELGDLSIAFNEMSKEIEEKSNKLLQEKERLDIIVNSLRAGLAVMRSDNTVVWVNPTLKEWLNVEVGIPCYDMFCDDKTKCSGCPGINEEYDETVMKQNKYGEKRIFRHRVYPLKHSSNETKESLILIEDITDQKEMEEVLIQTDKLSALGLMASSFAHEVNNPLATIKVYAEDLLDRIDEEPDLQEQEIRRYLKTINENTDRCKTITSNLLNFSRKSDWVKQSVDVNETIEKSIELIKHAITKGDIQLQLTQVPAVFGDALNLMQVIVNVVNNAVDAIEENSGTITIESSYLEAEKQVVVLIKDTGVGIEKENIQKVFDPFYTSKPVGKGTGLGLSVCYGIIKQFGGTLTITSEKGKGTVVTIDLPVG
ncbi:ATP-binding protein [Bacillaceae bacterium IKA-2]|nr:ATP-binding protein [Bacillaceae bacterium IKA-2]